ncbi:hypothetical protein FHS15_005705 [Paenibacillus castaneae]|uniref:hypothetical protein n=1 Tax=Paenibacillus castaneae TaxID=474957 RepID=UPI001FB86FFD|nr:hypothetical protein [Paenibacillus castaneae]NIK80515.1 hypothetical protein [Paenibacillus castaneae]
MNEWAQHVFRIGTMAGQLIFGAVAIYALLQLWPRRKSRWKHLTILSWQTKRVPDSWLQHLRLKRGAPSFVERELLLAGCGVTADPAWYMLTRRALIVLISAMLVLAFVFYKPVDRYIPISYAASGSIIIMLLLYIDLVWLRSIRKIRALQMTKEIFAVSKQLLYLSDSSLHIHTKLLRCLPFTRSMRGDLERLLAEWYHDAGEALQRFKLRIGTDEGLSFVETLDSLRQHESQQYYELLRVRIEDYKEKIELAKESRKESTSYILFIIAGIPILYTFQVFIYPWVSEAQKLFQSLN